MKLIIAGPRDYTDYDHVTKEVIQFVNYHALENDKLEIVSGACDVPGALTFTRPDGTRVYGVDGLGERLAQYYGNKVTPFPANWVKHGKSAGPIRNREMGKYATHALVFTRPDSKGSNDMLKQAKHLLGESNVKEVKIQNQ